MPRTQDRPRPPFLKQQTGPAPGLEIEMSPQQQFEASEHQAAGKLAGLGTLVTGADSGIGWNVAILFGRKGAEVAFTYLPEKRADAEQTIEAIKEEGKQAIALKCDVRDAEACQSVFDHPIGHFAFILFSRTARWRHGAFSVNATNCSWWVLNRRLCWTCPR